MSDLFDLYLSIVRWILDADLTILEHMGMGGGYIHGFIKWLALEAELYLAAGIAAIGLILWTLLTATLVAWTDRRVRARVQGRAGPRHVGAFGLLQVLADWFKLMLKKRNGIPSAVPAGVSGAMVLAALALMPLGPWVRLADPDWGLVVVTGLLALSPLPMAAMAPQGKRHPEIAEVVGSGIVLMLAAGSVMVVGGTARSSGLVEMQADNGWGLLLSPLGFLLLLVVMTWESDRLARVRATSSHREAWPGPHSALGLFTVAARYFGLGVLGALLFLGGWLGPIEDGVWWSLLKAFVMVAFTSMISGALPLGRSVERANAVRTRYLPLATLNLVLVAMVLEVVG